MVEERLENRNFLIEARGDASAFAYQENPVDTQSADRSVDARQRLCRFRLKFPTKMVRIENVEQIEQRVNRDGKRRCCFEGD